MRFTRKRIWLVVGLPADGSAAVVFEEDRLVGLLDLEHVSELPAARGAGTGGIA